MSDYAFVTGINSFLQQLPGSAISRLSCTHLAKNLGRPAVDHRGQDGRRVSGSPIIDKDGRAIGVVCTGSESENIKDYDGPHTHLMRSLPRWMTPLR